jgi:hypothetical protein
LGQELWRTENCPDLINNNCITNPRGQSTLAAVASAVGVSTNQAIAWLDSNSVDLHGTGLGDFTHAIWDPAISDANLATIEVRGGQPFGTTDADGDFSVRILDFCTTSLRTCGPGGTEWRRQWRHGGCGPHSVPRPTAGITGFAGEPHCADCHAAPYVRAERRQRRGGEPLWPEQVPAAVQLSAQGEPDAPLDRPPGVTCQGCHESIRGPIR